MNDVTFSTAGSSRMTLRQLPAAVRHRRERDGFRRLRNAQNHARILHREEAFGHDDVEINGEQPAWPTATSSVVG